MTSTTVRILPENEIPVLRSREKIENFSVGHTTENGSFQVVDRTLTTVKCTDNEKSFVKLFFQS